MSAPWAPRDDDERALLRAVLDTAGDSEPRRVYADWLRERGDATSIAMADALDALEILGTELARVAAAPPATPPAEPGRQGYVDYDERMGALRTRPDGQRDRRVDAARARLDALVARVPWAWVAQVDRAGVANCPRELMIALWGVVIEAPCPRRWEQLAPTGEPRVRYCDACRQRVYHCESAQEAVDRALGGQCVVLASRVDPPANHLGFGPLAIAGRPSIPPAPPDPPHRPVAGPEPGTRVAILRRSRGSRPQRIAGRGTVLSVGERHAIVLRDSGWWRRRRVRLTDLVIERATPPQ